MGDAHEIDILLVSAFNFDFSSSQISTKISKDFQQVFLYGSYQISWHTFDISIQNEVQYTVNIWNFIWYNWLKNRNIKSICMFSIIKIQTVFVLFYFSPYWNPFYIRARIHGTADMQQRDPSCSQFYFTL